MKAIKKILKIVLIIAASAAAVMLVVLLLNLLPFAPGGGGSNPMRVGESGDVHIVPHGGAKELYPENTVYSYRRIYERGWDTFEIDLVLTSDDVLVTHHDLDIQATTGVSGVKLAELDYEQLDEYNFAANFVNPGGERPFSDLSSLPEELAAQMIPARLEDLFRDFPDSYYILELKDTVNASGPERASRASAELLRLIGEFAMEDRVIVASFDDEVIQEFREASEGEIPTGAATGETLTLSVLSALSLDFFLAPKYSAVMLPVKDRIYPAERKIIESLPAPLRRALASYDENEDIYYTNLANERMVRDAHRKNLAVYFWTVNDPEIMKYLIEIGVDGIITDRPDILSDILRRQAQD